MRISNDLITKLESRAADIWDTETAHELYVLYSSYFEALTIDTTHIKSMCRIVREYAATFEISERKHVFKIVIIALAFGPHFFNDPRYNHMIAQSLGRPSTPADRRMALFTQSAKKIISLRPQDNRFTQVSMQLQNSLKNHENHENTQDDNRVVLLTTQLLATRKDTSFDNPSAFIIPCLKHCNQYELHEYRQRLSYCICAVTHGFRWFEDPLLHVLRELLSDGSQQDLTDNLVRFYERFA